MEATQEAANRLGRRHRRQAHGTAAYLVPGPQRGNRYFNVVFFDSCETAAIAHTIDLGSLSVTLNSTACCWRLRSVRPRTVEEVKQGSLGGTGVPGTIFELSR